jgi:hypothetical protein
MIAPRRTIRVLMDRTVRFPVRWERKTEPCRCSVWDLALMKCTCNLYRMRILEPEWETAEPEVEWPVWEGEG